MVLGELKAHKWLVPKLRLGTGGFRRSSASLPFYNLTHGKPIDTNSQANVYFFVGANLVFAPGTQGEHKVRPYDSSPFE
jgi:hypothetical protein